MKSETLIVAAYTDMPLGRNDADGPKNGLDYRETIIKPALDKFDHITVDFDGTLGTTPSFLEEVFGGLIRTRYMTEEEFHKRVTVKYKFPSVLRNVDKYVREASQTIK